MCRVRSTSPSPPSQEWHGVASGEDCGVYVRVCGVWGACRTRLALHIEQNKKRQQIVSFLSFIREETEKNAFGAWERTVSGWVMYAVRPHRPEACGVRASV